MNWRIHSPTRQFANSPNSVIAILIPTWLVFAATVYIPDIGRGFVKDDFRWIETGRRVAAHPGALFSTPHDFYRPLIAITFAVDARLHGLDPRWYGYENFLLYVACALALWQLARTAGLAAPPAALAAFVWAINPHGINMAVIYHGAVTETVR